MNKIFIIFSLFLISCSEHDVSENIVTKSFRKFSLNVFRSDSESAPISPFDYMKWVEDEANGLKVKKELGEYTFTLQYKPLDYVVLTHFKRENVKEKEFGAKKAEYTGMQYYTLRIQLKNNGNLLEAGISNQQEEAARLEYFAFYMQNDLQLIDGNDTLPCVLHHFERTYNITPYSDFVIGFEQGNESKKGINDKVLLYNDRALNLGIIKLKIRKEDIENTPTLIYKTHASKS